jgi:Immunity protein 21
MQYVSTFGGPQVLLPSCDINRWIDELGAETPRPDSGLYGLACSVTDYCGVISPWGKPILVFGDIPADIYWFPNIGDGLFARWIAGGSHDDFIDFVTREALRDDWTESTDWTIVDGNLTLIDSCTFRGDERFRQELELTAGRVTISSRYAADDANICVLHRIENRG